MLPLLKQLNLIFGRIICSWCGRDLGPYDGEGDTHGICGDCLKKELEKI